MAEKARERAFLRMLEHAAAAGGNGMMLLFVCFPPFYVMCAAQGFDCSFVLKKKEIVAY